MFKKSLANIKSFSPLRSSDRRRFREDLLIAFPVLKDATAEEGAPSLAPEGLQSAKFATHINDLGVVYMVDGNPVWIKLDKSTLSVKTVPSVYTLWKYPNMLPKIVTWGPVVGKLMGGADLMIPGLIFPSEGLPDVKEGELVAITIKDYPFPMAVGTMAISTSKLTAQSNIKGKAVLIIHVYKDHLWAMGSKADPPDLTDVPVQGDAEEDEEEVAEGRNVSDTTERTGESEVASAGIVEAGAETELSESSKKLSTDEVDAFLRTSLYHALMFKLTPKHPAELLPMSASMLYSSYILPSRPVGVGSEVDVKRSSWKKVAKFFKAMEKSGILKTKEQRGEIYVTGVNWQHNELANLKSYKTVESHPPASSSQAPSANAASSSSNSAGGGGNSGGGDGGSGGSIQVIDLYKPHGTEVTAIFKDRNRSKDDLFTVIEARNVLMEYVKEHGLVDPQNQRLVKIDALLCDALLKKDEYHTVDKLPREQLLQRLIEKMQPWHQLIIPGKNAVDKKGAVKPVHITVERRQGRSTVTLVTGAEYFDLAVDELVEEFKKRCASSAAVTPLVGASPKLQLQEIMVQGSHIKNVSDLLLAKGVPKKYIEVMDKTGKYK
ncbi:hypothetical protein BC936DRAFT_146970 [Jimgerdemannia flammicorona]|nr:hypothetical protein BC936DRAFT_146970 [Jimgerdemannia flammicorona]